MNKKQKKLTIAFLMMILVVVVASSVINTSSPGIISEPADFYGTSKEVSLDEMQEIADKNQLSIYLPSTVPKSYRITAIYLKEAPFIAIIVYSAEKNKDYKTAELTVEIAPVDSKWIPTFRELQSDAETSQDKTAMEINGWPVLLTENADIGGYEETRSKYGDTTLLINVWIEEIGYLFFAPTLMSNEGLSMIESMELLK